MKKANFTIETIISPECWLLLYPHEMENHFSIVRNIWMCILSHVIIWCLAMFHQCHMQCIFYITILPKTIGSHRLPILLWHFIRFVLSLIFFHFLVVGWDSLWALVLQQNAPYFRDIIHTYHYSEDIPSMSLETTIFGSDRDNRSAIALVVRILTSTTTWISVLSAAPCTMQDIQSFLTVKVLTVRIIVILPAFHLSDTDLF